MRPKFRFRPQAKGLAKALGDREAEIMEALWREAPATVSQVHQELSRHQKVAYTTIMTIMSRMEQKGLLSRTRAGNAYLYSPAISQEDFQRQVAEGVVDGLMEGFTQPAMSYFVERLARQDEAILEELERFIQMRRQPKQKD